MKTTLFAFTLLFGAMAAGSAFADYSLVCGKNHEHGFEKAELALVQDTESLDMLLYVDGKAAAADSFRAHGAPDNKWEVTVFDTKGDPKVRYEFREKPASVQAFEPGPAQKKIGEAKKCLLTDTDPVPAPPAPGLEGKNGALKGDGKKYSRK